MAIDLTHLIFPLDPLSPNTKINHPNYQDSVAGSEISLADFIIDDLGDLTLRSEISLSAILNELKMEVRTKDKKVLFDELLNEAAVKLYLSKNKDRIQLDRKNEYYVKVLEQNPDKFFENPGESDDDAKESEVDAAKLDFKKAWNEFYNLSAEERTGLVEQVRAICRSLQGFKGWDKVMCEGCRSLADKCLYVKIVALMFSVELEE